MDSIIQTADKISLLLYKKLYSTSMDDKKSMMQDLS